jgi:hypothetical protein
MKSLKAIAAATIAASSVLVMVPASQSQPLNIPVQMGPLNPGFPGPDWRQFGRRGTVCFYEDYNYRGRSFCAREGDADRRLTGFWNDRISSIRIMGNASVRLCENWNYGGRCTNLAHSDPSLRGRNNDIVSSYRIAGDRRPVARVCFYEDYNYKGDQFCANEGQADRRLTGKWNDRISSVRVFGDAKVRVCENWDYGGRCTVLANNDPALTGRNNDIISSYRVM